MIALQALSEYASFFPKSGSSDNRMDVGISYGTQQHQFEPVTGETMDLLQIKPLNEPSSFDAVNMEVNGSGLTIATLQTTWYIPPQAVLDLASSDDPFDVKVSLLRKAAPETRRKLNQIDEPGSKCILAGVSKFFPKYFQQESHSVKFKLVCDFM